MKKIISVLLTVLTLITIILPVTANAATTNYSFREATGIVQQYRLTGESAWRTLTPNVTFAGIDGVLLHTENKPYYLKYKSRDNNRG